MGLMGLIHEVRVRHVVLLLRRGLMRSTIGRLMISGLSRVVRHRMGIHERIVRLLERTLLVLMDRDLLILLIRLGRRADVGVVTDRGSRGDGENSRSRQRCSREGSSRRDGSERSRRRTRRIGGRWRNRNRCRRRSRVGESGHSRERHSNGRGTRMIDDGERREGLDGIVLLLRQSCGPFVSPTFQKVLQLSAFSCSSEASAADHHLKDKEFGKIIERIGVLKKT